MSSPGQQVYDHAIIGGGIAGLFSAFFNQKKAQAAGIPFNQLLITDRINVPSKFGTILIPGFEGCDLERLAIRGKPAVELVRQYSGQLGKLLAENNIDAGYIPGYQMFGNHQNIEEARETLLTMWRMTSGELETPARKNLLPFAGVTAGLILDKVAGQINVPPLQSGLVKAIENMGGKVIAGEIYTGHEIAGDKVTVKTASGNEYHSKRLPLLATGAEHMAGLNELLPSPITPAYTIAFHVRVDHDDALRISPKPTVFCDTSPTNVVCGAISGDDVLTFCALENEDRNAFGEMQEELVDLYHKLMPFLGTRYDDKMDFSFGAMSMTKNGYPIIGRLPKFDVMTGFCSIGILPALAAANAYANHVILGDDSELRSFETLNIPRRIVRLGAPVRRMLASEQNAG